MIDNEKWFDAKLDEFKDDAGFYAEQLILGLTEQIVAAMKDLIINRAELASRLGVSRAFVTKLLNGNPNMTLKTMASVAKALGCAVNINFCPEDLEVTMVYTSRKKIPKDIDFTERFPVKPEMMGDDNYECAA